MFGCGAKFLVERKLQEQKPGAPQPDLNQGPLKQMYGIDVNGPDIKKDGLKPCKWLEFIRKIFENTFKWIIFR